MLTKATEGLQSRDEIVKISNGEVSIEQEVSKKQNKTKTTAFFKNKNPIYYFLGEFSILLLCFTLFCFIRRGKFGGRLLLQDWWLAIWQNQVKPCWAFLCQSNINSTVLPETSGAGPSGANASRSRTPLSPSLASLAALRGPIENAPASGPWHVLAVSITPHLTLSFCTGLCSLESHSLSSFCLLSS